MGYWHIYALISCEHIANFYFNQINFPGAGFLMVCHINLNLAQGSTRGLTILDTVEL